MPVGGDGAETHLTKHLPGFGLVEEPHDDPGVLALKAVIERLFHLKDGGFYLEAQ